VFKIFPGISEGDILTPEWSPQPTTRTPAEKVMARALLALAINFPALTTFLKIKPFGLYAGEKR